MSVLAILGSSRDEGNTSALLDLCLEGLDAEVVSLVGSKIAHWDYDNPQQEDDFPLVAQKMVAATTIVFASPVYWYAMSGTMKVFFDRFSELLSTRKDVGKSLAGRKTWLVASGGSPVMPEGFDVPFAQTSEYFKMTFGGCFYGQANNAGKFDDTVIAGAKAFAQQINS